MMYGIDLVEVEDESVIPVPLIYGDFTMGLVFVPEDIAFQHFTLKEACRNSRTWGDLHEQIGDDEYRDILGMMQERWNSISLQEFISQQLPEVPPLSDQEIEEAYRQIELPIDSRLRTISSPSTTCRNT